MRESRSTIEAVIVDARLERGWFRNAAGRWCSPECRGWRAYELTVPCWRNGYLMRPGQRVVVNDEIPSVTWRPLSKRENAKEVLRHRLSLIRTLGGPSTS